MRGAAVRAAVLAMSLGAALLAAPAAARTDCPTHFARGAAPEIVRPALAREVRELCFEGFAVLHSGVSRTPLAVAERLTRARIAGAREVDREGNFHEEERLPPDERARLSDYARSGFDRGHMAPSGDMATRSSMAESFSLANIVPQHPASNRCLWERIESAVRDLANEEGEIFVVTGPIFAGEELERIGGRVLVPTHLYKAVHVPGRGAAAYVTPNGPGTEWREVSLTELRDLAGIEAFPGVSSTVRARAMNLPDPRAPSRRGICAEGAEVAQAPARAPSRASAREEEASGMGVTAMVVTGIVAVVLVIALIRVLGRR